MKIKAVQWNIGGGYIRSASADPASYDVYSQDGLGSIVEFLKHEQPDVITLQETHVNNDASQAQFIAQALGGYFWANDEYAHSHLARGYQLGQAIISKYPLSAHGFSFFSKAQAAHVA